MGNIRKFCLELAYGPDFCVLKGGKKDDVNLETFFDYSTKVYMIFMNKIIIA